MKRSRKTLGRAIALAFLMLSIGLVAINAQETTRHSYQTQQEIKEIKERIRSLFAQGQNEQVLQELDRLEKIDPGNAAVGLYRQMAERRLREGASSEVSPSVTPATTTDSSIPPPPPPATDNNNQFTEQTPESNVSVVDDAGAPDTMDDGSAAPIDSRRSSGNLLEAIIPVLIIGFGAIVLIVVVVLVLNKIKAKKSATQMPGSEGQPVMEMAPQPMDMHSEPTIPPPPSTPPPFSVGVPDAPAGYGAPVGGNDIEHSPVPHVPTSQDGEPVTLGQGDFEEVSEGSDSNRIIEDTGGAMAAPPIFNSSLPHGEETDSSNMPVVHHTQFDPNQSVEETGPSVGEMVGMFGSTDLDQSETPPQLGNPAPPAPMEQSASPFDFPFEGSQDSGPDASSGIESPSLDMDSASNGFGFDMSFEMDGEEESKPVAETPGAPPEYASNSFEELSLNELSLDLGDDEEDASEPGTATPQASQDPGATGGINLDDFMFAEDLQTNVPGVSTPDVPPPMAGESQFPEIDRVKESPSSSDELVFGGSSDETNIGGGTNEAEAATIGFAPEPSDENADDLSFDLGAEDETIIGESPDLGSLNSEEPLDDKAESEADNTDGQSFIVDGDTRTEVSEETRIISPNNFEVSQQDGVVKEESVPRSISNDDVPQQAGPMDQTALVMPSDKKDGEANKVEKMKPKKRTSESLFEKHFDEGKNAFDEENWKDAIYHLNVAYTLKPNSQDVREKLREARRRRKEARA